MQSEYPSSQTEYTPTLMHLIINRLFKIGILFMMLAGAQIWISWVISTTMLNMLYGVVCVISLCYAHYNGIRITLKHNLLLGFTALFAGWMYMYWAWKEVNFVLYFFRYIPLLVLCLDPYMRTTVQFLIKWLGIILLPGLILYLIAITIGLPPTPIITNDSSKYYVFFNYLFYIRYAYSSADEFRFCGPFLEPGYLGTMCSFLLYSIRFDLKPLWSKVILTAIFLSFSLAGIIITVLGYLLLNLQYVETVKRVFTACIVIAACWVTASYYNNGDNVVNERVFSRLQFDEQKGISGNNRFSEATDYYYDNLWKDGQAWTGMGEERIVQLNNSSDSFDDTIRGAGYKVFILRHGIVACLIFLLVYLALGPWAMQWDKKYGYGYLFLVFLTFLQASYPASLSWLIPYVIGIGMNNAPNPMEYESSGYLEE